MTGCGVNYTGPDWFRADPVAVSDTVDNLRNAEGAPFRAILNRSAATMLVSVVFRGDYIRTLPLLVGVPFFFGSHWKRIRATGTTGGGTSGRAYETILTTAVGAAFTNQPANDGLELLSSSAADTSNVVIYGTTQGTDTVVVETIALTGTAPVSTVKTDWGLILGVEKLATTGTVTIREASADATVTTLGPTVTSKGVESVPSTSQAAYNVAPMIVASGASTKQVGLAGTNAAGTVIYDSQALTGATALAVNSSFATVTRVFTGDVEGTVTVTVSDSADLMVLV